VRSIRTLALRPASTLNQKSFSRGFAGKNILSVSPRLLKDFKRCGLVTPKPFGA
jgi:hypothetical protein